RLAGAQARYIVMANAAGHWRVPVGECTTLPGKVIHQASGREMSYGDVAAFGRVITDLPALTADDLKPPSQWRLIGRDVQRPDVPYKVTGSARYGMDAQLPGMLYASLLRPPVATCPHPLYATGAENGPVGIDDREALQIEGVTAVVRLDHAVAVVGTDYWA